MWTLIRLTLVLPFFAGPCCAMLYADGGQIRVMQQCGDYRVTVFTSPTPLRAGAVDVSVLVQDAATGEIVPDATVTVELEHPNQSISPIRSTATVAAATNKLLQSALVDIPTPGLWNVSIECTLMRDQAPIEVAFAMEAAPPLPRWLSVWPWFTWPIIAIVLFAIHRTFVARRSQARKNQGMRAF